MSTKGDDSVVRETNIYGQAAGILLSINEWGMQSNHAYLTERIAKWAKDYEDMLRLRDEALAFRLMDISQ